MALGTSFETVDPVLPLVPRAGAIYFFKGDDDQELDLAVGSNDGELVFLRKPALQMAFGTLGAGLLPADKEFGRYLAVEDLALDALMSGAVSSAPAAAQAIITVQRDADLVARFTFPAGQSQAIAEIIMPTVPAGSVLLFRSPSSQDISLSGVTGTLGARRI